MTDKEIIKAFNKRRIEDRCKAIIRPKFTMYKELFQFISAIALFIALLLLHSYIPQKCLVILLLTVCTVSVLTQTKNAFLLIIFAYQRFAPKLLRSACLFQPSCSEYTKQCIIKYGVIRGVHKGYKRIKRCRPPNGGIDEP